VSFVAAFVLTAMPLPEWALPWRPAWVPMVLIYWCIAVPERVGVGIGWMMGLLLDVLRVAPLGQHAAGLAIVAFIAVRSHQRVRMFPLWQQAVLVGFMLGLYLLLIAWIRGVSGDAPQPSSYWLSAITSMLLWPWLFVILRDLRRKGHVS
jgi:rod shape-determining protein MreD